MQEEGSERWMIIDPDFLDHWRTAWLIEELGGDKFAPFYLIRLWGHCQLRRSTRFEIPPHGVKGICKAEQHSAIALEQALIKCEYLARDGDTVEVLKWAEQNAALLAAWSNGGKGGRPTKDKPGGNPSNNPGVSDGLPDANPPAADGDPDQKPRATETKPIREEKRGDTSLRSVSDPPADPPAPPTQPAKPAKKRTASKRDYTLEFEQAWAMYPQRPGNSKADAFKAWNARIAEGKTAGVMCDGVHAYARFCEATGKTGTEFVKQAATFFGPGLHFETAWTVAAPKPAPAQPSFATVQSNDAAITAERLQREAAKQFTKPSAEQRQKLLQARQDAAVKAVS